MSHRLGEKAQIFSEILPITSAAGATSMGYSMEDCSKITFICGLGTVSASTASNVLMTAVQSADKNLSTNAAISGATAIGGVSTAKSVTNARSVLMTISSASTDAETISLNGYTLTQSTVGSSTVSTALTFGSTAGTTSAAGLADISNSLSSVINNSTLSYFVTAATASTSTLRITANDTASTGITLSATGIANTFVVEKAHTVVEVLAEDLNSTSKYVGVTLSTGLTAQYNAITVIKEGLRHEPYEAAQAHKKST